MSGSSPGSAQVDARLTELEIKLSFTEDLLDTLNELVTRQQLTLDMLLREVGHLRQQDGEPGTGVARNPRDELPPHY